MQPTMGTPTWSAWYDKPTTPELWSAPVVGDVDGDHQPDVVAGMPNGYVYAWHLGATGPFLHVYTGAGAVQSTLVLRDVNGDGVADIVGANTHGDVFVYTGHGARIFHAVMPVRDNLAGGFASPVVADLDHNGHLEIIESGWDQYVWAWNLNGSVKAGFPVFLQDTSWSSPVVADLDGDGYPEIVVGYDCSGTPGDNCYRDYHAGGGYVTVIRHNGALQPGWPRFVPGQVIWSTPALGDLNGDGKLDVVVGTGLFWPAPAGQEVIAWDRSGHGLPGWPVHLDGRVMGSPAIGDIDGDGRNDVVFMTEHDTVYAVHGTGSLVSGWPKCGANSSCPVTGHASASLADVTGDGKVDVVTSGQTHVNVFDGHGHLEMAAGTPAHTGTLTAAPTIVNISGVANILAVGYHNNNGAVSGNVFRWSTGVPLGSAPWPQFRQNVHGTGHVEDLTPPSAPGLNVAATQSTTKVTATVSASDSGSGVAYFTGYVRDGSATLAPWFGKLSPSSRSGSSASASPSFYAFRGHSYYLQVRAVDAAGNPGPWSTKSISVPSTATYVSPVHAAYTASTYGDLQAPYTTPVAPSHNSSSIYRGVAASKNGGGYLVDLYGAIHAFGGAPSVGASATWGGHDYARGIALNPDGKSGYTLDCFGRVHPFGGAVAVSTTAMSSCAARSFALTALSTASHPAGYIVDIYGGLRAFGLAPVAHASYYVTSNATIRGIAAAPNGIGGYTLDEYGNLHPFGGAPAATGPAWHSDIARGVALASNGQSGWVIDRYQGIHAFGGAIGLPSSSLSSGAAMGISVVP